MLRKWDINDLKDAVANSSSIAGVLRNLRLKAVGGNYKTVNDKIRLLGIDTSHLTGQGWNVGNKAGLTNSLPIEQVLVEDSPYKRSYHLKRRLLRLGLIENKCLVCSLTEWLGSPIALELDHINGTHSDNRITNLRLLCPNCHSQTETYRGRNIRRITPKAEG